MYTELDQETLDIDWFFTDDKYIGFVASACGILPKSVAELDIEDDEILYSYINSLIEQKDFLINTDLNEIAKKRGFSITEKYLSYFIMMSKKGFYSFNKTDIGNRLDTNYHLVTKPVNPLRVDEIPKNILNILKKTYHKGDISNLSSINIEEIS